MNEDETFLVKELPQGAPLPVVSFGEISNVFLVHLVNPVVPSRKLPELVRDSWDWGALEDLAATNNIWVAVDANWARSRAKEAGITLTDAIYDIVNCCGVSAVGASKGLKKGLLNSLKNKSFLQADLLHHDGSGFSNDGNHPQVLYIRRLGMTDRPVLSVIGNHDNHTTIRSDSGRDVGQPTASIIDFPKREV